MDPDDLSPHGTDDDIHEGPAAREEHPGGATPQAPPRTGDRTVDEVLESFDGARHADPATRLAAATEAHRALQARLTAPAPPPPVPGEARPGPRR